ncbi:MAG: tRNA 2-thiouridine(34) synthase MnmA [Candidatus Taylorbacteria bacterium RIFCSPHIGHO2_01_FULL_51_15]|uniref:tRNA-specific 2-thiouridylase MnmA n=1 Tax=Candidatus Taylorbacteria bacterium RIFCSPHIGHO2_01_FULL_51_15 TaxID=1802304 RepID=A0A1G2MA87_9BACT|nr:MAG: tRNA 2-thiouridine(34) synthase MnmA [Candidatus Taylorbacteria bacterium RIFCSPHIGHO2_01_FULL_51_15]
MNYAKEKVFVGLSGGVDSSVSAALLKKQGHEVTGVFIKVWQPDFFDCTWKDDRLDAMRVCAELGIPFIELDLEKEYRKEVVDYMIAEYKAGKTPNPDVMCNRFIKFGGFYKFARKKGAHFIATGHYARVETREFPISNFQFPKNEDFNIENSLKIENCKLKISRDLNKDQSYFLWQIRKEQLPHILFPVGGMKKTTVRKLAKRFGLITADKKDSQGLCFVGKVDMKEFLSHYIQPKKGKILDEKGSRVGEHHGAFFYTIGERIGGVTSQKPHYVVGKDMRRNTVTVSRKSPEGALERGVTEVEIKNCNWLAEPIEGKTYGVRTRYREALLNAALILHNSKFLIRFTSSKSLVAPGQSLVLYDGDILLGGGIIA